MGNSLSPRRASRPSSSRRRWARVQGREGTLRLGLEGKNALFISISWLTLTQPELHSLLFHVFKDDGAVEKVPDIEGDLSGQLVIGEKIKPPSARVSILKAALKGSMIRSLIPSPSKKGIFQYTRKIGIEGVPVALSAFPHSLIDVTQFSNPRTRQIEISSAKFL